MNVCGTPTRFVAFGLSSTRYCNHVFDAVNGTVWSSDRPGDPATVRSTTRPSLSVKLVTVNVPVPADGDVTLTVHVPNALVTHGLGVTGDPAPVQVNAIDAPAAGTGPAFPTATSAAITKSCCVPTGLVADGVIVTK